MLERDETILFSSVAVLLAAMTLWSVAGFAYPEAQAAGNTREIKVARYTGCASTAQAPPARAGQNG